MNPLPERRVSHVCVVQQLHRMPGVVGVTAIDKVAVDGPVTVHDHGLFGDVQADRVHHGGLDKAVYAIAASEVAYWEEQLDRELPPGVFGENLRIEGPLLDDALIGERWRIGESLELEVTGPRTPCRIFSLWLDRPGLVKEYTQRGRPGVYFRVRVPGTVRAGDAVHVLDAPAHGISVRRWFSEQDPDDAGRLLEADAAGEIALADYLRKYLIPVAGRGGDVERLRGILADDAAGMIELTDRMRAHLTAAVERADAAPPEGSR